MARKIYAPNKQYTGISASVPFVNGVGESSDPSLLEWFQKHGYEVEDETEDELKVKAENEQKDKLLESFTVKELHEYAEARQIDLGDATKKDEILAVIKTAEAAANAD
ncbi:MAG: hypothetical protein ACE3L7_07240 [Candidatus Pristimantibacillus sp.]